MALVTRALEAAVGPELSRQAAVGMVVAWFAINLLLHWRERRRAEAERRRAAAAPRKVVRLDQNEDGAAEWQFRVGFHKRDKFEFFGGGNGRPSWLPGDKDTAVTFDFDREKNPNTADRIYRRIMLEKNPVSEADMTQPDESESAADQAATAAIRGAVFYSRLQAEGGFWPGDYGGPMFLLPGLLIACRVCNIDLGEARRAAMLRYVLNHQQAETGGWGMHIEGGPTVFGSVLNYTAARLLGLDRSDPRAIRGRDYIKSMGGAVAAPQWAKFWLATLGVYEWSGVNPTPPELFLLPKWFPFHPGRMWNHCRMVYLPMATLFGSRYVYPQAESDSLVRELREELYVTKYEDINWGAFNVRECIAPTDLYNPQSWLMTAANHVLYWTIENPTLRALFHIPLHSLRQQALKFTFEYINAEDRHTHWLDVGPVSKAFHLIATYAKWGADAPEFTRHIPRIEDYLWLAEDGMKMQGNNGSMLWDTCFATHAVANAVVAAKAKKSKGNLKTADLERVYNSLIDCSGFVDVMQIRKDPEERDKFFRDRSTGGWPFSSHDHGWPISDCTAEGIKAAILLSTFPDFKNDSRLHHISQDRLEDAVRIVLDMQNTHSDNGWASYEQNRGYTWYEYFNPAQVFGDIMIDYSYVECTSAAVQSLCEFAHRYPNSALAERAKASARLGTTFIIKAQRPSGGWYGSWAVCFTYAAWFGVEGLTAALSICAFSASERTACENAMNKGCQFLLDKQCAEDGSWGEDVEACAKQEWVDNPQGGQVVQTAWSVLALVRAAEFLGAGPRTEELMASAARGCAFIRGRQQSSGDWEQECITGIFNKSCAITYTAYRNIFPIWALARFSARANAV